MAVTEHKLRLYRYLDHKSRVERQEYLDPTDTDRLRELLVELTTKACGGMRVSNLADGWQLWVMKRNASSIVCKVSVDSAGRTVVTR